MSDATQDDHKGRLAAMKRARDILAEHFDAGFIVVTHMEEAATRFAKTEWGNKFAIAKLALDYADGELEPMLDEVDMEGEGSDPDADEDEEGWKKV
jgi:hypothetical protein